ncbi:hypothetical protein [uncultured Paludibaculum sp.]|uniref:hypothetical protein n=1 Tax=uncultured Paludibaculum sp. TaxID=1765020 RepID=UPI00374D6180
MADTGNNRVLAWRDAVSFTNGAPADLVIGQKDRKLTSAVPWGLTARVRVDTGSAMIDLQTLKEFPSGLNSPSSVAFRDGYLFVADAGNNRILRYRQPFTQWDTNPDANIVADLVIGQPDQLSNGANSLGASATVPSATSIRTNMGAQQIQSAGLAFDPSGNLWFTDAGNHRVLQYLRDEVMADSPGSDPIAAHLVLGQVDFSTATANPGRAYSTDIRNKSAIRFGSSIAFDSKGTLYFADDLARVLVWSGPVESSGRPADRIVGVLSLAAGATTPPLVNDVTFGATVAGTTTANITYTGGPRGLFCVNDSLFVVDTINSRLVRFAPYSSWPTEDASTGNYSPRMVAVYGQPNFNSGEPNAGSTFEPSPTTYGHPVSATFAGGELYVADNGNNRVVVQQLIEQDYSLLAASRVLGQTEFALRVANMLKGSEFSTTYLTKSEGSIYLAPSVAIDRSSTPPRLYIADPGNNRVLCFADALHLDLNTVADFVLGQVGLTRGLVNSPYNDPKVATLPGLSSPSAVLVDKDGKLWVADTGNGRVLRFPNPFAGEDGALTPDLVLGQPDFDTRPTGNVTDSTTRDRLYTPTGLALSPEGGLVVSDLLQSRVLYFRNPQSYGQAADLVLGQASDTVAGPNNTSSGLAYPRGLAVDSYGRLYVADNSNSRIQIWDDINSLSDGAASTLSLNQELVGAAVSPFSITIDPATEKIWVADGGTYVVRFPSFNEMSQSNNFKYEVVIGTKGPSSVALDPMGFPIVADAAGRLTMHFPTNIHVVNGANGYYRVAPAAIAKLRIPGVTVASEEGIGTGPQLPTVLADVEVIVNGIPAPLLKVGSEEVKFQMPRSTTTSSTPKILVRRVSTGQILGYDTTSTGIWAVAPGVFFQSGTPQATGQARALNQDGTANSVSNPAKINDELTIFLTGYGAFDGMPDDGVAPGTADLPVPGDVVAALLVGTTTSAFLAPVVSSTLDPDEPGVWRVRIKPPDTLPAGTYTVNIGYRSWNSLSAVGTSVVRPTVAISR